MGFMVFVLIWLFLLGFIIYYVRNWKSTAQKKQDPPKKSKGKSKISGYGGPDFILPPGICLEEEIDETSNSKN